MSEVKPIGYNKEKAKQALEKYGIDVLIASSPVNLFYASGLPTLHVAPNPILYVLYNQFPSLCLIRKDGEECLDTWMVYQSTAKSSWVKDVMGNASPQMALNQIKDKITQWGFSNGVIGLEALMPRYQSEFLRKEFPNAKIVEGDMAFLDIRLTKSEEEINRIKKSTQIAEKAILSMMDASKEGITDNELLQIARRTIVDEGAEGWDHLTMNIGPSDPEAPGFGYSMKQGEISRFDVGAIWKGYVSDVSRHIALKTLPEGTKETMDWMIKVQDFCVDSIKPGVNTKIILEEAKKFSKTISKYGRPMITAHSIGLECEEVHLFSPMRTLDTEFKENMVLDIEVWNMFKDCGLVGVEDCYIVTSKGCERITTLDKNILIK